jgi:hypothetical protein
LSSFAVTIESADDTRFLRIDDDNASNWSLMNLSVGDQHAGAVAMHRQKTTLVCREIT